MRPIDADALPYKTHKWRNPDGQEHEWTVVDKYAIDNAPTIVPSGNTKSCGVSADKSADQKSADVPSGDLISREEAIEAVGDWMRKEYGYLDLNRAERLIDKLSALPSADRPTEYNLETIADIVKQLGHLDGCIADMCDRQKGEWLDVEHEPFCECSVCGAYIENLDDDFAFCPRCGADMRGADR